MKQCLRCNKPCGAATIFCDSCRVLLQDPQANIGDVDIADRVTARQVAISTKTESADTRINGDPLERLTMPYPVVDSPKTPLPPLISNDYANIVEQAFHRLSDAARSIESAGQEQRGFPHTPRLSPLRDISAEIERHSTPIPQVRDTDENLQKSLPDLWPWLGDEDGEEEESNAWINYTDPLARRKFLTRSPSYHIVQRHTQPLPVRGARPKKQPTQISRLRIAFICLVLLAVVGLAVDSVLAGMDFLRSQQNGALSKGLPTLTLSSSMANYGQRVTLHIRHFSSSAQVYITHDIGGYVKTGRGSPLVQMAADGSADIVISIDNTWNPGFHTLNAEDTLTRYTANTTLRITSGPTRPSQLIISTMHLDFGAGLQGANTLQPLTLHNGGSGVITWAASSDQPWLLLAPNHGTFSDSQTVAVGIERTNLQVGDYSGKITFASNVGVPQIVPVTMSVQPLPPNPGPVLSVTPVVLAFTATDGIQVPDTQNTQPLVVSNPGSAPLYWSLGSDIPNANPDQPLTPGQNANWLVLDQQTGVVQPGATDVVLVHVNSQAMLQGVYSHTLSLNVSPGHSALNSPQNVDVSLTVQPRCGITLDGGGGLMSFTAIVGRPESVSGNQLLNLTDSASCTGAVNWNASAAYVSGPSTNWLTLSPPNGQVQGTSGSTMAVGVNMTGLIQGTYTGNIIIATAQMTQSVPVQLTVQSAPAPMAPVMSVSSPSTLNFSTIAGQTTPGQAVIITNTGGSPLNWSSNFNTLASRWFGGHPSGSVTPLPPGDTTKMIVNVSASTLSAGTTTTGTITLTATDANGVAVAGSGQTITVNLTVLQSCTLSQPASLSSFTAVQGEANPHPQDMGITALGDCSWPLNWSVSVVGSAPWLQLSATSGSLGSNGSGVTVAPNTTGLVPGTYSAQVSLSAPGAQGSPQIVPISLTITGFAMGGTVNECASAGGACKPLAGAVVTLVGSAPMLSTTADATGHFSFMNMPLAAYTISASGTDGAVHYVGSVTISLASDQQTITLNTLPG